MTANTLSQINLHYRCAGEGPDVLLLHGWASSGRMWSPLVGALAEQTRLWAVDLFGFGDSPRPVGDQPVDMALHEDTLVDFCRQHDIHPKLVIGHSMGGMLALKLALNHPELAERLLLLAPVVTGRFGYRVDLNRLIASDWGTFALAKSKPFWILSQNVFMPLLAGSHYWYLDTQASARIVEDYRRASWQAAAYAIQSIARENLEPCLTDIAQPALVMVGSWDTTVPPGEGRLAAGRMPNARLLELPRVRHQILDERPEQVIAAVATLLPEARLSPP
jgi:pimeloyl-ACP methyl ester carboxylesterase